MKKISRKEFGRLFKRSHDNTGDDFTVFLDYAEYFEHDVLDTEILEGMNGDSFEGWAVKMTDIMEHHGWFYFGEQSLSIWIRKRITDRMYEISDEDGDTERYFSALPRWVMETDEIMEASNNILGEFSCPGNEW